MDRERNGLQQVLPLEDRRGSRVARGNDAVSVRLLHELVLINADHDGGAAVVAAVDDSMVAGDAAACSAARLDAECD